MIRNTGGFAASVFSSVYNTKYPNTFHFSQQKTPNFEKNINIKYLTVNYLDITKKTQKK